MKLLIIPDSHANENYDNKRFRALGNFIVDERPDVIVNLGDMADMASLSLYDEGKACYEGRRYCNDIAVTIDALEEMDRPILEDNRKRHKAYHPRKIMCLGNHENRINRAIQDDAKLEGTISIHDLKYQEHGWNVHAFMDPASVGGIAFSHYFVTGVSGHPISGENIGRTMCNKLHASAVQGHSHVIDLAERVTVSGKRIFGLSAGCFVHPEYIEDWCSGTVRLWWKGLIMLDDLDGYGYYNEVRAITQSKLMKEYL